MGSLIHSSVLLAILFATFCIFLIPAIMYLLTLQRALVKCDVTTRTMQPAMVWLLLVPLFNLIWNFFVVMGIAKSLAAEFTRRGIPKTEPLPGQTIGMVMCICACCGFIPVLGVVASLGSIVMWIVYWIKIADYSRQLDAPVAVPVAAPPAF